MAFLLKANFKPLSFSCILAGFFKNKYPYILLEEFKITDDSNLPDLSQRCSAVAAAVTTQVLYLDRNEAHACVISF